MTERTGLISVLSLTDLDRRWQDTCAGSTGGRLWAASVCAIRKLLKASSFGSWLQFASFIVVLMLVAALGARQFATDKEGLALFVVIGLVLRVLGTVVGGKERNCASAIDALVLTYLAANIVAAVSSHYLAASLSGLSKLIVLVGAYFLFTATVGQSRTRLITTLAVLVTTGVLVSLYGLYQYKIGVAPLATWEDPTVEIKGVRIYSTLGNPNLLAGYLVPLVPLAFSLAAAAACSKRLYLALPALGATAVIALAVVLTGSRGGYIGLAGAALGLSVLMGSWLWRQKPQSRLTVIICLVAVAVIFGLALHFVPTVEQRVLSIFAGAEHTSNRYRLNVWIAALKMFQDNWWFGVGVGNKAFELAYGLYMTTGFDALGTYCLPLEVAVETGVLGLAAFGALIVAALARAHVNFYASTDSCVRWLIAGCTSAVIGMMAHGMVDTVFYRPQVQLIFWMMIAVVAGQTTLKATTGKGSESA